MGESYLFTHFTLNSLCYLVIVVATNFNLHLLNRHISDALVGGADTGALYVKKHAYIVFRALFFLFVLVPSVTIFLQIQVLAWDEFWVCVLVNEILLWSIHT